MTSNVPIKHDSYQNPTYPILPSAPTISQQQQTIPSYGSTVDQVIITQPAANIIVVGGTFSTFSNLLNIYFNRLTLQVVQFAESAF